LRAARHKTGSVRFDKRRGTWNYLWYDKDGTRRSKLVGTKRQYATKTAACKAVEPLRAQQQQPSRVGAPLVRDLAAGYREEKMPKRYSTRRVYESWLNNHILPRWGNEPITVLEPRPVELWILSLKLSPRSMGSIRGLLHALWKYAMWSKAVAVQENPMTLITIKGSSKRQKRYRSLTAEEFQGFLAKLDRDPFRTIALVSVCFGLRISECLALKWSDVDWLASYALRGASYAREWTIQKLLILGGRWQSPLRCLPC